MFTNRMIKILTFRHFVIMKKLKLKLNNVRINNIQGYSSAVETNSSWSYGGGNPEYNTCRERIIEGIRGIEKEKEKESIIKTMMTSNRNEFSDTEASTILGMESTWFAVVMVCTVLAMAGLVTAGVLCFYRQRVTSPRHPHNAYNAQGHPPVGYPSE